jgi:hypothetical protein
VELLALQGLKPIFGGGLNVAAEAATHKDERNMKLLHRPIDAISVWWSVANRRGISFVGQGFSPDKNGKEKRGFSP